MKAEDLGRYQGWLLDLATDEEVSAAVLANLPAGDPSRCLERARMFRELAALIAGELAGPRGEPASETAPAAAEVPAPEPPVGKRL